MAAWAVTTATITVLGAAPTAAARIVPAGTLVPVVVHGASDAAAAEVTRLGGVVDHRPGVLDGVRARVPAGDIGILARVDGVRAAAPDGRPPSGL